MNKKQEKMEQGLVPRLRFAEFQEEVPWEEKKFYDLLDDVIDFRGRTPAKLGMSWGGGNIISLSANNVKTGYIDYSAECNFGSEELYKKWMGNSNLEQGDIVFTMEAPLGNAVLVPDSQKYILSQRVVAFKTNKSIKNIFLIQQIWGEGFQKKIATLSTGSTAKGINQKSLKKITIEVPQKKEQQRIADCLSSIDELITAQEQKIQKLEEHKKALLQKLFPEKGESVPVLRFAEFKNDGEWEEKILGEQLDTIVDNRGKTPPTDDKGIPLIEINAILSTVIDYSKIKKYVSQETYNTWFRKHLKDNDILFSTVGKTGLCSLYKKKHIAAIAQNIIGLRFSKKNNSLFMLYLFSEKENHRYIKSIEMQAVQPSIKVTQLVKLSFLVPRLLEQQRIADCLSSLDDLIAAHGQKLELLKQHKKGLMQGLFPVVKQ